jgi:hypothetical protein
MALGSAAERMGRLVAAREDGVWRLGALKPHSLSPTGERVGERGVSWQQNGLRGGVGRKISCKRGVDNTNICL